MYPYIGITDFTNFAQVQGLLTVIAAHQPQGLGRRLHVGVMMSYTTLQDIPSEWQRVFPPKESIADIFASNEAYNCLHYAEYGNVPDLWKRIARAVSYGGSTMHALQLDMTWPDPGQIALGIRASQKHHEVILQIGKKALKEVNNDPQALVEKLKDYEGVIQRILLDMSMGRGVGMDATGLIPFARAVAERFPLFGIGVAGGLGPETLQLVRPLAEAFPDISIDAQGRLRPSGNMRDPIDWDMAKAYLLAALQLFSSLR